MKAKYSSYLTLAASTALSQGFLFLVSPVVTRLFTPEDFGGFGLQLGIGALIASVGSGRLEHAIPVSKSSAEAIRVAVLGAALAAGASILSALILIILFYFDLLPAGAWQGVPFLAIPALAFSLAFYQIMNALLLRQRAYHSVGLNKIFQGGATGVMQPLLGWFSFGSSGLILAQISGYLAGAWGGARKLLARIVVVTGRHVLQFRSTFWRYRRFPIVLAPAALFNQAAQHFPVLAFGYIYGLYEAGLYALVLRICGAPLGLVGHAVAQVYAAEFRDLLGRGSGALAGKYIALLSRLFAIGIVVVGCAVIVLNLWGTTLFGKNWANIGTVSLLLAIMFASDFATTPISMTLGYLKRERAQLWWDVGRLIAVVLAFVGAHNFSLRFGQTLLLFSSVWSLCLLIHVWITYRACRGASISAA